VLNSGWITFSDTVWGIKELLGGFWDQLSSRDITAEVVTLVEELVGGLPVLFTNLGRTALFLGLKACGLGNGDKIILPTVVCPTVIRTILRAGCEPVLADVGGDLHITVDHAERAFRKGVKAILVPHLYGQSAEIEDLERWAQSRSVLLIDDAAQALGVRRNGRCLGSFGAFGIVSFGPFKNIGVIRGGALATESRELMARARAMSADFPDESGMDVYRRAISGFLKIKMRGSYLQYWVNRKSFQKKVSGHENQRTCELPVSRGDQPYRLSRLDTRLILGALRKMERSLSLRSAGIKALHEVVSKVHGITLITSLESPAVKVILRLDGTTEAGKAVRALRSNKLETERIYKPLHLIPKYKCFGHQEMPGAEAAWRRMVLIPNSVKRDPETLRRIRSALHAL